MAAGVLDAGLASFATFLVGLYAVRVLDPTTLGGYALCYQAIFLVGIVPGHLIFAPAEVAAVGFQPGRRLDQMHRSLALGTPVALAAALAASLWVLVAPAELDADTVRALTATAVGLAFLSPIQDHLRAMLHSGDASWIAVAVSATQLVTVAIALVALSWLEVPAPWLPFGALAIANLVSLTVGLVAIRRDRKPSVSTGYRFAELVVPGRWLTAGGRLSPAAGFAAAAVVSRLAGADALGYAEAARVVAQPIWVLAVGLSSVMRPKSMEAARRRARGEARAISRTFVASIALAGAGCMAVFGPPWRWNPLLWLLPNAYVIGGLTLLTLLSQTVAGVLFPYRSELIGAGRADATTKIELGAGVVRVGVALTAATTHAYAIPLSFLTAGIVRGLVYRRLLDRLYAEPAPEPI